MSQSQSCKSVGWNISAHLKPDHAVLRARPARLQCRPDGHHQQESQGERSCAGPDIFNLWQQLKYSVRTLVLNVMMSTSSV